MASTCLLSKRQTASADGFALKFATSLLQAKSGKVPACLLACLACSSRFPVSWQKVDLGSALRWIGWHLDFCGAPSTTLPCDKLEVMLGALSALCLRPRAVPRAVLQKLIGRLVLITPWPWLQVWFFVRNKPGLKFFTRRRNPLGGTFSGIGHKLQSGVGLPPV